ncbi:hypothetical protein DDY07_10900 [Methylomonas sp. ZR1]|nr:hypothetical protein [Methylomonas sp. ZR1]
MRFVTSPLAANLLSFHSRPAAYAAETDSDTTLPTVEVKAQAAGDQRDRPCLIHGPPAQNAKRAAAYIPGLLADIVD